MFSHTTININDSKSNESHLDSDQLREALTQFCGTELWYRHYLMREMLYTDGIKFFAENAGNGGAYWFLDTVALFIFPMLKTHPFLVIDLKVNEGAAIIDVGDGNDKTIYTKPIDITDVQEGEWKFYLTDNILLLPSEY